eukprot:Em0008g299a
MLNHILEGKHRKCASTCKLAQIKSIIKCLVLGIAGVGKTCLKRLLLQLPQNIDGPIGRVSTGLADNPIQALVGSVNSILASVVEGDTGKWEVLDETKLMKVIANAYQVNASPPATPPPAPKMPQVSMNESVLDCTESHNHHVPTTFTHNNWYVNTIASENEHPLDLAIQEVFVVGIHRDKENECLEKKKDKWFVLEMQITRSAVQGVLSLGRCLELVQRLGIDIGLETALKHMVKYNLFLWYHKIPELRDVVISDPQVILKIITDPVQSFLQHKCRVVIKDDVPECLYKDCVRFKHRDFPAQFTIIDSILYIEVHLETCDYTKKALLFLNHNKSLWNLASTALIVNGKNSETADYNKENEEEYDEDW